MRIAFIIVGLTAIAVGLVHIRRGTMTVRHDIQRLESRHVSLRREIWDRRVRLEYMLAPGAVKQRSEIMALGLTTNMPIGPGLVPYEHTCQR